VRGVDGGFLTDWLGSIVAYLGTPCASEQQAAGQHQDAGECGVRPHSVRRNRRLPNAELNILAGVDLGPICRELSVLT